MASRIEVNRDVNAIVRSPDWKIVLGGLFVSANGKSRRHVLRLEADLSIDESLVVEALDSEVDSLAIVDGREHRRVVFSTQGQAEMLFRVRGEIEN